MTLKAFEMRGDKLPNKVIPLKRSLREARRITREMSLKYGTVNLMDGARRVACYCYGSEL